MNKVDIWHKPFTSRARVSTEGLSVEETLKAEKFYREEDRQRYITAHLFLRAVLSHYFPSIKAETWCFEVNAYGKPSLAKKHGVDLHFNLSHSASHIYIVCCKAYECGIDVEEIKEMELTPELLNLVMSKEEQQEFLFSQDQERLFFKYWTLKEAHVKALGKGVSLPLNCVSFKALESRPEHFSVAKHQYYTFYFKENFYLSFVVLECKEEIEINFYKEEEL